VDIGQHCFAGAKRFQRVGNQFGGHCPSTAPSVAHVLVGAFAGGLDQSGTGALFGVNGCQWMLMRSYCS